MRCEGGRWFREQHPLARLGITGTERPRRADPRPPGQPGPVFRPTQRRTPATTSTETGAIHSGPPRAWARRRHRARPRRSGTQSRGTRPALLRRPPAPARVAPRRPGTSSRPCSGRRSAARTAQCGFPRVSASDSRGSDVSPARVHVTQPTAVRLRRQVPKDLVIDDADLAPRTSSVSRVRETSRCVK